MLSPLGELTLSERDGRIVSLDWGRGRDHAATATLTRAVARLQAYFDGAEVAFDDLPLEPSGTPFQRRVWQAMRAIPRGQTRRYGDIARALGSSPRAVGAACGRNPLPILIPCHRVVGAAGALGGYSGPEGAETKRFLLALEAAR
ncbi:MAG: methylated-DNA--[protein]-cysteine S-methyltransferase [Acetobacteraceae bacterium]